MKVLKKVQALEPLVDRILVSSDRFLDRNDHRVTRLSGTVTSVELAGTGLWKIVTASGYLIAAHDEEFELEFTEFLANDGLVLAGKEISRTYKGVSLE